MSGSFLRRTVGGGTIATILVWLVMPSAGFALTTPSAPRSVTGVAGNKIAQASLSWLVPSDTGGGIGTYLYEVSTNYDSNTDTGTWSSFVDLRRTKTKALVPCAAAYPAVCSYRMYARNDAGTSVASTPVTVAWSVPSRARNLLVASPNFVDATLTWSRPTNTGGVADTYDVAVSNDNGASWTTLATDLSTLGYSAPGSCTDGTVCKYEVWAKNVVGTAASASNIAQTNVAPGLVQSLVVTHNSDDVTTGNTTSGTASMTISWAEAIRGLHDGPYELQECFGNCARFSSGWSAVISIPHSTPTTTRTCPANVVTCSYRVRSTNQRGGRSLFAATRFVPVAPVLAGLVTGPTSGTVTATFTGPATTGPASVSAHYKFLVCDTGCATGANWSVSSTTVTYPPATTPTTADVVCPTAGASCTVRVRFVNDVPKNSMVSTAFTATAAT